MWPPFLAEQKERLSGFQKFLVKDSRAQVQLVSIVGAIPGLL